MKVPLKKGKDIKLVDIDDILYFDIYRKVIFVHTTDATYQTLSTLSDWEFFLGEYGFERLSQSNIINMKKIKHFEAETNRVFFEFGKFTGVSIPNIKKVKNYIKKNR